VIEGITDSTPVATALRIIIESHYHDLLEHVNIALVVRDVNLLIEPRTAGLPNVAKLLSTS